MAEYISGEKYKELKASQKNKSSLPSRVVLIAAGIAIVLCLLSFVAGIQYQKGKPPKVPTTATVAGGANARGQSGFGGRFGGGARPAIGQVTAVDASSITVQNSRDNSSTTYSITSDTKITDNNQTVAVTDIKVGDNVLVRASTSSTKQAASILVNPSFQGGFGQSAPGSSDSSTPTETN